MGFLTNTRLLLFFVIYLGLSMLVNKLLFKLINKSRFRSYLERPRYRFGINVVSLVLTTVILMGGANFYVYYGFDYQPDIYRRGSPSTNYVALTFDDGPSPEYTPLILDILKEKDVTATFFLVGSHVEKYPDIAKRIVKEGHEVGNHTYHHVNIPTLKYNDLHREILLTNKVIHQITGESPSYLRPPRGMYDARYRRLAHLLGQDIVLWTISGQDWKSTVSARAIVSRIVNKSSGGEIILLHDSGALIRSEGGNHKALVEALPQIIDGLREKGLEIVPLKILLSESEGEDISHLELNITE